MSLAAQSENIDPLLECLVLFTKLNHRPFSAEALVAGLPVGPGKSTPELFSLEKSKSSFSRAAARAGFTSRIVKRKLNEIPTLVLPAILVLKGKNACILVGFDKDRKNAKVILPDLGEAEHWVNSESLKNEYLGYAFFIKAQMKQENKTQNLLKLKNKKNWFWGTLWRSRHIYFSVLASSLLINLFVLAQPLFTMNVYDRVIPNNAIETLWVLGIGVFVIFLFDIFLKFIRSYFLEVAGKKSDIIMSSILFEQAMNLKMAVKPKSVGSFASNLRDFDTIRNFISSATISTLIDLPFAVIFLLVIYFIAGNIVIIPIASIVVIVIVGLIIKGPLQSSVESTYESGNLKNSTLVESLVNIETIKTMGATGHAQWRWEESSGDIAQKSVKTKILSNSITNITTFVTHINTIGIVIIGVYMIQAQEMTMGGLIAAMILSSRAISPMSQVAALTTSYAQTKTAIDGINNIMQMEVERPEGKKFVERPNFRGKIEFKNVTFAYPEETKAAIENITFTINPSEHVAFIGKIGSGKTTIEKLILGLYQAQSGTILIDGIDINQIDPADLRKNIGYVPQDVELFQGTVKENIVYKTPDADDREVLKAATISNSLEFINRHPLGFNMQVGESGSNLSGGQRQSIAVARAFVSDAQMILLDEPTNSMDNSAEMHLLKSLAVATVDKTTILVTHKTTILPLVNRIIVIDNGHIAMDGPKEKVIKQLTRKKGT